MKTRNEIIAFIKQKANLMRKDSLEMALEAGSNGAHLGPGYSMMEIMATLYFEVMRHDPQNPYWDERDRFILSKGHGVLGFYTALAESGYFPPEILKTFETTDSFLAGHPSMDMAHGIEITSGSLGHGLSIAEGIALAGKKNKKYYTVYVYLGDGECNEGSIWESAMSCAHFGLDNMVAILDRNKLQSDGICRDILCMGDMAEKWKVFGWQVTEIDGHDVGQILDALHERNRAVGKPNMIIANTIKGKGVSFFENDNAWHHKKLTPELYDAAMAELA